MPTELNGDIFKPFIGLVNQFTLVPVGRLVPWKMTRCTLDPASDKVDTPSNAIPGFHTEISAKRQTTGKMENASFDMLFNIFGSNPNMLFAPGAPGIPGFAAPPIGGVPPMGFAGGTGIAFHEGMFIRMLCVPFMTVPGGMGIGDVMGVPIVGAPGGAELIGTLGTNAAGNIIPDFYIFLALRVSKIHHMADAAAGQPFDFDFATTIAYAVPGESMVQIAAYGFNPVPNAIVGGINNGGFL